MGGSEDASARRSHAAAEGIPSRLAEDRFYRALASTPRRRLLYYLLEHEECTVEELASALSGWEATTGETGNTSAGRSEVRLQLLHNHLPRLADTGLIAYDSSGDTARLEPLHPRVTRIIRQSVEAERPEAAE